MQKVKRWERASSICVHRDIAGMCTQIGGWCFTFAPVLAEFSVYRVLQSSEHPTTGSLKTWFKNFPEMNDSEVEVVRQRKKTDENIFVEKS